MGRGRVRMAKAKAEMVRNQIEQDEIDFRHAVYTLIEQFHNQRNQCAVAARPGRSPNAAMRSRWRISGAERFRSRR